LDREQTLDILQKYGVGTRLIQLLRNFWKSQQAAVRQCGYYSSRFNIGRGVTQGDIPSPDIFNVVIDDIVRYWMANTLDYQCAAIDGGTGWLEIAAAFYADDGIITSHEGQSLERSFDFWTHYLEG
jgi:hypothetical protein